MTLMKFIESWCYYCAVLGTHGAPAFRVDSAWLAEPFRVAIDTVIVMRVMEVSDVKFSKPTAGATQ